MTEEVKETSQKTRRKKVYLSDHKKLQVAKELANGESAKDLAEKYNIPETSVRKYYNDAYRDGKVAKVKNARILSRASDKISFDAKTNIVDLYKKGYSYEEINKETGMSESCIRQVIIEARKTDTTIPKKNKRNNSRKKLAELSAAKEVESPKSTEQTEEDAKEAEDTTAKVTEEIVVDEDDENVIKIADKIIIYDQDHIRRIKGSDIINSVNVGVAYNPTNTFEVSNYIFPLGMLSENISDTEWQKSIIVKYIENNFTFDDKKNVSNEYMNLFCMNTGYTIPVISIIQVCNDKHVNLKINYYDLDGNVVTLDAVTGFGNNYASSIKDSDNVFGYDCSLKDILEEKYLYCIRFTIRADRNHTDKKSSSYLIFKDIDTAWNKYLEYSLTYHKFNSIEYVDYHATGDTTYFIFGKVIVDNINSQIAIEQLFGTY